MLNNFKHGAIFVRVRELALNCKEKKIISVIQRNFFRLQL